MASLLKVAMWGFVVGVSFGVQGTRIAHAQEPPAPTSESQSPLDAAAETPRGASPSATPSEVLQLHHKVEELESQIHDLQVALGALETFIKSQAEGLTTSSPHPSKEALSPLDEAQSTSSKSSLEDLEVQVRVLSARVQELSHKRTAERTDGRKMPYLEERDTFETSTTRELPPPSFEERREAEVDRNPLAPERFQEKFPAASPSSSSTGPPVLSSPMTETNKVARSDPALGSPDPRQEFDQAYGLLVQKNYAMAQTGFKNFIKAYPNHALVPNAVFWLGETHYGQGNYADAAEAFDLVLQGYGNSPKAPESLVKKGMSLAALGKKAEACAALGKLSTQYPNSPLNIKTSAREERSRMGCP